MKYYYIEKTVSEDPVSTSWVPEKEKQNNGTEQKVQENVPKIKCNLRYSLPEKMDTK